MKDNLFLKTAGLLLLIGAMFFGVAIVFTHPSTHPNAWVILTMASGTFMGIGIAAGIIHFLE